MCLVLVSVKMRTLVRYCALICSAAWIIIYIACSKHYDPNVDHSTIYSYDLLRRL